MARLVTGGNNGRVEASVIKDVGRLCVDEASHLLWW